MDSEDKEDPELIRACREQLLFGLINKARLGIVLIDQGHRIIDANARFCEMLGYSAEEIKSLHTWDWEAVMSEEQIREQFKDLSVIDSTFETVHRRKDGSVYDVEISATGMSPGEGKENAIMCICRDISANREAEAQLARSEKRFRNYVENAADVILTLGAQGVIKYISPNCLKVYGYAQTELEGARVTPLISPEDKDGFTAATERAFACGGGKPLELRLKHKDGSFHWYGLSFSRLEEDGGTVLICNARNIDENKAYEDKLKFLSLYDQLTGAANRAFFNQEMKNPQKMIYPVSVLVCDFDGLKAVNDRYGHAAGDRIIITTSKLIKSALRKEDLLARLGGDEFAVLLKGASREQALRVIDRIREAFNKYNSGDDEIKISISIGLATAQDPSNSLQRLVHKADKDMYSQKTEKRSEADKP